MTMHDHDASEVDMTKKWQREQSRARHAVPLRWVGTRPRSGIFRRGEAGLTLIELIVVMIVISVALVGVMSVVNYTTRHSADPVLRHQAIAIAEAYMEEIVLKEYDNPPGGYSGTDRSLFDDVSDYNGLPDNIVRNPNDIPEDGIPELKKYKVEVVVIECKTSPHDCEEPFVDVEALKITVTVTDPANNELILTSYRTDY